MPKHTSIALCVQLRYFATRSRTVEYLTNRGTPRKPVKPDPNDPTWTFPYATRQYIEKLRDYFRTCRKRNWHTQTRAYTHALTDKEAARIRREEGTNWPSVPPQYRAWCEEHFNRFIEKKKAEQGGTIRPGQVRGIRMRVACFGRHGYERSKRGLYGQRKAMWLCFNAWETENQRQEYLKSLPPTQSKILDVW
jgi:hypothetical protein